jgi:hypothetical protein
MILYNKYSETLFLLGIGLVIIALIVISGIVENLFGISIPQQYGLLIIGIGLFLIAGWIYLDAKGEEKQHGTMSIIDRSGYVKLMLGGIISIIMFFYLL